MKAPGLKVLPRVPNDWWYQMASARATRGVGVAGEGSLGRMGELKKNRVVFLEEGEVTAFCNVHPLFVPAVQN